MGKLAEQVAVRRATRNAAKASFDRHYGTIRADMEERGIAGRIIDETLDKARDTFDETIAVIEDNPAVVGGTLAALALWLCRNPIRAWVERLLRLDRDDEEEPDNG